MTEFHGYAAFRTHISDSGYVCIEQDCALGGDPSRICIPVNIWEQVTAQIKIEISEYESFLQENLENP